VAGFSFYQYSQVNGLRQELTNSQERQAADVASQLAAQNNSLKGTVSDLQEKLSNEEQQTTQSIAKVQDAAKRHADVAAGNVQKSLEQKSAAQQAAIDAELAGVKNAASDTATKIDGVGASVDSVKTDLASTKAVVDKTAADLQRASGDLGVMSGLIATNGKQIQELRNLGDRNIYEFTITKKNGMQKVGDVQMRLTKSDTKHNRYTMVVMADDKFIEKKDKTTNEPVQFYAAQGSRIPDEVVVNEVGKDTIKGYLATPKISTARN
jgi:chromosome segregation ATPase